MNTVFEETGSIEKPKQNPYILPDSPKANPSALPKGSPSTSSTSPRFFAEAQGTSPAPNTDSLPNSIPSSEGDVSIPSQTQQLPSSPYQVTLAKSVDPNTETFLSLKLTPLSSSSNSPASSTPDSREENSPLTSSTTTINTQLLSQALTRAASESAGEKKQEQALTIIITPPQSSSLLCSSIFTAPTPLPVSYTWTGSQTLTAQPRSPQSSLKRREEKPELFETCQKKFYQVLKDQSPLQNFLKKRIPYFLKTKKDTTNRKPIAYQSLIHPDLLDLEEITEAFRKRPSEDGTILKNALQTFADLLKEIELFQLTKVETRILLSHIKVVHSICIILDGCYRNGFSMEALYPYLTCAQEECAPALQMQAEANKQYKDHTAAIACQRLALIGECLLPRDGSRTQQVIGFLAQLRDVFDEITKKESSLDYLPTPPCCPPCSCICQ